MGVATQVLAGYPCTELWCSCMSRCWVTQVFRDMAYYPLWYLFLAGLLF